MPRTDLTLAVAAALVAAGVPASANWGAATLYVEGANGTAKVYRTPGRGTAADLATAREALARAGFSANPGRDRLIVRTGA